MIRKRLIAAVLFLGATPISAQQNALDLHLEHQRWTRLQDHQTRARLGIPELAERPAHERLIARIEANIGALETAIPEGRHLWLDGEGIVHILVAGEVDEAAVIALAQTLLESDVAITTVKPDLVAVSELIDLRGLLIYSIDRAAELAVGLQTLPPDLVTRWEQAVRRSYDPDTILPTALDAFALHMDDAAIAATRAFLEGPEGRTLRRAEQAFLDRELVSYDTLAERVEALAWSDPRRHGLYVDLGKAIQGSGNFADMEMLLRALLVPSLGKAVTEDYILSVLETYRAVLPKSRTAYAMELLPDHAEDELESILEFFRSPAGQAFADARRALHAAVFGAKIDVLTTRMAQ